MRTRKGNFLYCVMGKQAAVAPLEGNMDGRQTRSRKRAAFSLITALAFTLIVGTVLAGVGTVSMSHFSRAKVEGSYANAVALADAGVNYELAWISRDTTDASRPHQYSSQYTGSIPGVPGTFKVYVKPWGTDCDGTGTWTAPSDVCVVSTGTANGVSRTVRVRGVRKSIFDEYAIYAYDKGVFSGGGSSSTSTEIVGNMGTNGGVTFNGSSNTDMVNGLLSLNGPGASSSDSGSNVAKNPDAVIFPDVAFVANKLFGGGLSFLQTTNSNSSIKMLSSADTSLASEPTLAGLTLADVNSKLVSAGFTTASRTFSDPPNSVPSATSALDAPSAGSSARFVIPADATYNISAYGIKGLRTYFLPPGDYYFNNFDFKAGTSALVFLTHLGRIRIWVDQPTSGAVKDDNIKVPVIFTDTDPSKFRLFYNKCSAMNLNGNARFNGGFYAIKSGCSAGLPNMDFSGNSMVYGSVITENFKVTGGSKVVFPNNGGADPTDFSLWFGFKDNWKEILAPSAQRVFADGTQN